MIRYNNKLKCCGCSACESICPVSAISMHPDAEGFLYPVIDNQKCINCGLCENVCMYHSTHKNYSKNFKKQILVAKSSCVEDFLKSSSGGILSIIAKNIILQGGYVFGASFSEDFKEVHHVYINKLEDIKYLQGSKYVQSNPKKTFKEVKSLLKKGEIVLFVGTPCQIVGLRSFLQKDFENLLLVDVACFGVPSPKVWKEYLEEHLKTCKNNLPLKGVFFRKKEIIDNKIDSFNFVIEPNIIHEKSYENIYGRAFIHKLSTRPSCGNCIVKNEKNLSDITLGDCWGIEKIDPNLNVKEGLSLILVNTLKGKIFAEKFIKNNCSLYKSLEDDVILNFNKGIRSGTTDAPHFNRDKFFRAIGTDKISTLINKYDKITFFHRVLLFAKRKIKNVIQIFLR